MYGLPLQTAHGLISDFRKRIGCSRVFGLGVSAVRSGHHEIRGRGPIVQAASRAGIVIGLAPPGDRTPRVTDSLPGACRAPGAGRISRTGCKGGADVTVLRRGALAILVTLVMLMTGGTAVALDPDKDFHHYVRNRWSIEEGLPQISGLAIEQDRLGYLWVGTQAGLARFDGARFTSFNPDSTPGLAGIWIHDLHVDRRNRLWIATYRGLSVYEDGRFQ